MTQVQTGSLDGGPGRARTASAHRRGAGPACSHLMRPVTVGPCCRCPAARSHSRCPLSPGDVGAGDPQNKQPRFPRAPLGLGLWMLQVDACSLPLRRGCLWARWPRSQVAGPAPTISAGQMPRAGGYRPAENTHVLTQHRTQDALVHSEQQRRKAVLPAPSPHTEDVGGG